MKRRYLKGVLVLLAIFVCSACASRSLAPPRCDLATAIPINVAEVSTESKASVGSSATDVDESAGTQDATSKSEVRQP